MSPLAKGRSDKTISKNIGEMMKKYHATGKIGNTTPMSARHAQAIAAAAAFNKAGRGKKGKK